MPVVKMEVPLEVPEVPQVELLEEDGEPLESDWHRITMNVLIDSIHYRLADRTDFYVGGNMFIYFSEEQARNRDFRGPDFFFVWGASHEPLRRYWVVWLEGGKYPNVIIELTSPKTTKEDHTTKKQVYEQVFRTPEYYCYDPFRELLEGWRLDNGHYQSIEPDPRGWLWCRQLQLWLGTWQGQWAGHQATWLRFYDSEGQLVLLPAEAQRQRAEAERQRAEVAEAELARLRAQLEARQGTER